MKQLLRQFHNDERAVDLIEYALLALLIALAAITTMGTVGQSINREFSRVAASLT